MRLDVDLTTSIKKYTRVNKKDIGSSRAQNLSTIIGLLNNIVGGRGTYIWTTKKKCNLKIILRFIKI